MEKALNYIIAIRYNMILQTLRQLNDMGIAVTLTRTYAVYNMIASPMEVIEVRALIGVEYIKAATGHALVIGTLVSDKDFREL